MKTLNDSQKPHYKYLTIVLCFSLLWGLFISISIESRKVVTVHAQDFATPTEGYPEEAATVQQLISDEDCLLPCWWGLNLGVDNGRAVEDMLYNSFGPSSYQKSDGNDYSGVREGAEYSVFYLHLNTRNEIRDGDLASEGISFWVLEPEGRFVASRLSSDLPALSYVDWTPYMPSSLLSKYGAPDLVTFVYPTDILSGYSMIMRYFDLGLFVGYDFPYKSWVESNKSILICNQLDNDFMYLFRLGVTVVADYFAIPENNPWPGGDKTMWYERRLEDITTFDLETFTELFSHENVCFTTLPIDEWPDLPPPTE
ncbi:MAG: hypothetical protein D8M56_02710 [Chloroflexi bacterium]|nr:hypothetical protein [Chloroflexota bacterium]